MRIGRRLVVWATGISALAVITVLVMRPAAVRVEVTPAVRGPLQETLEETGLTRVRRHVVLAAPVAGRLAESSVVAGDSVPTGAVVATLFPLPLDPRSREQLDAALGGAQAMQREAETRVDQAVVAVEEARRQRVRVERLAQAGGVSERELEDARVTEQLREADLAAARARLRAAAEEERRARAAVDSAAPGTAGRVTPVVLRSPMAGRILRLFEEHEKVIPAGTPLVEIGDPATIDIVTDVLSSDVTAIHPGTPMWVRVAGNEPRRAIVHRIEAAAFTKVSPLGIEEQRVNVTGRFAAPPTDLGDRYAVDVSFVLWEAPSVLKVPATALVPVPDGWGVYVADGGRARLRQVRPGHRGATEVEIGSGLQDGDVVIRFPDERIADGTRISPATENDG